MNRIIIITAHARGETRVSADAHLFFEKRKKRTQKGVERLGHQLTRTHKRRGEERHPRLNIAVRLESNT